MIGLLPLFLGCADPPAPSPAEEYLAAAADQLDPSRCAAVADPALAADCLVWSANALARVDGGARLEEALAACRAAPGGLWRDECFFQVADAAEVTGPRARRACDRAGRFRNQCLGHAIARDIAPLLAEMDRQGGEQAALAAVEQRVAAYLPGGGGAQAWIMVRDRIAVRAPLDQPFSLDLCGDLSELRCREIYAERVRRVELEAGRPDGWRRGCPGPATPEAAAALGLHPWAPDAAATVAAAWRKMCEEE